MRRANRFPNFFAMMVPVSFGLFLFSGLFMGCEKEVKVFIHDTVRVDVPVEIVTVDSVVSIGDPVEGGGSLELTATTTAGSEAGALTYAWFATAGDFADSEADTVTWTAPDDSGAVTITVHATDGTYIGIGSVAIGVGMYAPTATEWYIGVATCATCHTGDGTGWKDKYTAWDGTAHASAFDPSSPSYCAPCHTVGGNGLDATAEGDAGYDDAPIAAFEDVQCEVCHGRGSAHQASFSAADITISYDPAETCGKCHTGTHNPQFDEWLASDHDDLPRSYMTAGCQGCHEGAAAAYRLSDKVGLATYFNGGDALNRTGGGGSTVEPDTVGVGCATCHDPHDATNEHQLRTTEDIQLVTANGRSPIITSGGSGKLCMQCHHARSSADDVVTGGRFNPHHSIQTDMLTGNTGYEGVAPDGFAWAQPNHAGLEEACVTCHMHKVEYNTVFPDSAYTGHQFDPRPEACVQCHGAITDFEDIMAFDDYDGNGVVEGARLEVLGLIDTLTAALTVQIAALHDSIDTSDIFAVLNDSLHYVMASNGTIILDSVLVPVALREAGFNITFVDYDGSGGMHNFDYSVQLLQQAFKHVTGSLPAGAAPLIGNGRVATR